VGAAGELIHRIVTLGTPHRGIAFQRTPGWVLEHLPKVEEPANELAAFNPASTQFRKVADWYPIERILTVIGTNYRTYGGQDSLVTSREAYEIAMRFFHGSHRVRLWLDSARVLRGKDWFGRSEFYLGVSIKPRYVDFDLFHQSPEAENCYGPFHEADLSDGPPPLAEELSKPIGEAGRQDHRLGRARPAQRYRFRSNLPGGC